VVLSQFYARHYARNPTAQLETAWRNDKKVAARRLFYGVGSALCDEYSRHNTVNKL